MDDDDLGGEAACWAHLVDEGGAANVVDLAAIAATQRAPALRWSLEGADLNLNLLVFDAGDGVREHVNHEVDVAIVGIAGAGVVIVDSREHPLRSGQLILVPKDARRGTRATADGFSYLTCHRRRGGLMPAVR